MGKRKLRRAIKRTDRAQRKDVKSLGPMPRNDGPNGWLVRVNLKMPVNLHTRLKVKAAQDRLSIQAWLVTHLDSTLPSLE